jgi:adenosylmethionine-8-amino-7-oxononanoate aminotransferase
MQALGGANNKPLKCGPPAQLLSRNLMRNRAQLTTKFRELAKVGTIAVLVEMVQQASGHVLTSDEWENICISCEEANLYLIVDEALTAVRCGAPFAHQLPQFQKFTPSFVYFGKFLATAGLAIC